MEAIADPLLETEDGSLPFFSEKGRGCGAIDVTLLGSLLDIHKDSVTIKSREGLLYVKHMTDEVVFLDMPRGTWRRSWKVFLAPGETPLRYEEEMELQYGWKVLLAAVTKESFYVRGRASRKLR